MGVGGHGKPEAALSKTWKLWNVDQGAPLWRVGGEGVWTRRFLTLLTFSFVSTASFASLPNVTALPSSSGRVAWCFKFINSYGNMEVQDLSEASLVSVQGFSGCLGGSSGGCLGGLLLIFPRPVTGSQGSHFASCPSSDLWGTGVSGSSLPGDRRGFPTFTS